MNTLRIVLLVAVLAGCAGASPTTHAPAPGALGPYSGAVEAGELVLLSGRIGERRANASS